MPNDPTLKNVFGNLDGGPQLNVDAILRRARRRRLPKQLAAGGVLTLAVGGIAVGSVQAFTPQQNASMSTAADSAADAPSELYADGPAGSSATTDLIKRAPADRINLCTGTLAEVAPSQTGLVATTHFDTAKAGASVVRGTVTVTNTGTTMITGTSGSWVSITLSKDGIVLWHTNGAHDMMAREISLAPGGSVEYDASFEPVSCSVDDDLEEGFPAGLPPLEAGEYQVSAAIDIVVDENAELISGPTANITLK